MRHVQMDLETEFGPEPIPEAEVAGLVERAGLSREAALAELEKAEKLNAAGADMARDILLVMVRDEGLDVGSADFATLIATMSGALMGFLLEMTEHVQRDPACVNSVAASARIGERLGRSRVSSR